MNVTSYGKRDLADVRTLRVLRWGDYPGLSGDTWGNHRVLLRGKQEIRVDVQIEARRCCDTRKGP